MPGAGGSFDPAVLLISDFRKWMATNWRVGWFPTDADRATGYGQQDRRRALEATDTMVKPADIRALSKCADRQPAQQCVRDPLLCVRDMDTVAPLVLRCIACGIGKTQRLPV
jgi:hypothetical protein